MNYRRSDLYYKSIKELKVVNETAISAKYIIALTKETNNIILPMPWLAISLKHTESAFSYLLCWRVFVVKELIYGAINIKTELSANVRHRKRLHF